MEEPKWIELQGAVCMFSRFEIPVPTISAFLHVGFLPRFG